MTELETVRMTDEEMIDTLKGLVFGIFDRTTRKEREALNMAIQKLEKVKGASASKRLSETNEDIFTTNGVVIDYVNDSVLAWVPLPQSYEIESEE